MNGSASCAVVSTLRGVTIPSLRHRHTAKCRVAMCRVAFHFGVLALVAHFSALELSSYIGVGCSIGMSIAVSTLRTYRTSRAVSDRATISASAEDNAIAR